MSDLHDFTGMVEAIAQFDGWIKGSDGHWYHKMYSDHGVMTAMSA